MRFLVKAVGLSAALLFTGCNEEADPGGQMSAGPSAVGVMVAPVGATINSAVVQGQVRNAVVTASRWQSGGYVPLATALTDGSGNYSLTLPAGVTGYVRLEMGLSTDPDHPTEMLCVAVQCGTASFGEWYPLTVNPRMSSWASISSTGTVSGLPITPFSTLAVRYAEQIGGGSLGSVGVTYARRRVAQMLGISLSAMAATPGNITDRSYVTATSAANLKWPLLVAAVAERARADGVDVATVIDRYATAFVKHHGQLVQLADPVNPQPDVASLIQSAIDVNTAAYGSAGSTLQAWLAQQQSGVLNPLPPLNFDSEALLTALGPMGLDIRSVMQAEGATSLEQLIVNQLSEFRWLATQDTVNLAAVSAQTVLYSMMGSALLANLPAGTPPTVIPLASGPLMVTLNTGNRVLTVAGSGQGMTVNLNITLTALNAGSTARPYLFTAVGTVTSANIRASINGTLKIDPTTTNLTPLLDATRELMSGNPDGISRLMTAIGGILQSGRGVFTIYGNAGIESLTSPGSVLSVVGKAAMNVDMAGGTGGAIKADGSVYYGTLTLPNGDRYTVDYPAGDYLRFALNNNDGTVNARFSAYPLSLPQTVVQGTGKLTRLGVLLNDVRDEVTRQLAMGQLNVAQVLDRLTGFDYSQMSLTVRGQANILGSYNHLYTLSLIDGALRISQPNSTDAAIRATGDLNGAVVRAGNLTYVMGVDLQNPQNPGVVVGDAVTGGLWRRDWASL